MNKGICLFAITATFIIALLACSKSTTDPNTDNQGSTTTPNTDTTTNPGVNLPPATGQYDTLRYKVYIGIPAGSVFNYALVTIYINGVAQAPVTYDASALVQDPDFLTLFELKFPIVARTDDYLGISIDWFANGKKVGLTNDFFMGQGGTGNQSRESIVPNSPWALANGYTDLVTQGIQIAKEPDRFRTGSILTPLDIFPNPEVSSYSLYLSYPFEELCVAIDNSSAVRMYQWLVDWTSDGVGDTVLTLGVGYSSSRSCWNLASPNLPPGIYTSTFTAVDSNLVVRGSTSMNLTVKEWLRDPFNVVDPRDGATYPARYINGRTWMLKNMQYVRPESWLTSTFCADQNLAQCAVWGAYYTEEELPYACPAGWSVASAMDWFDLKEAIGDYYPEYSFNPANALTSSTWLPNGADILGFGIIPSGYWSNESSLVSKFEFQDFQEEAYFLTSSENGGLRSSIHFFPSMSNGVVTEINFWNDIRAVWDAMNVRCVQ